MNHTFKIFKVGLRQIKKDGMLLILLPAPFFIGILFKFAIPYINSILMTEFSFSITAWYGLIDGMLICLTPMFVAMISAFLLLEERDEGLYAFYQITPSAGYSYLMARIGFPMVWAFFTTLCITFIFHLSSLSICVIFTTSLISSLTGIFLAMMVVSIAGNRVEGLAISKLMGISFLGLFLIWFVPAPYHYVMAFLPSFWIGDIVMNDISFSSLLFALFTNVLWIAIFTRRYLRKV